MSITPTMPRPARSHRGDYSSLPSVPAPGASAAAPDKLIHVTDLRHGVRYTLAVPPSSPWHELLPQEQTITVRPHAAR